MICVSVVPATNNVEIHLIVLANVMNMNVGLEVILANLVVVAVSYGKIKGMQPHR